MIFSVLSLLFYGYFYCLCLFHIVVDNDILQRVLKSVTKNGEYIQFIVHDNRSANTTFIYN